MRKLTFLIFTFIILTGINVGKAQTALPYSINFADSQEGWTAVDESSIPGNTWTYMPKWAYIQGKYYGSIVLKMDYSSASNDYYISPDFSLEAGKTYAAEFNICSQSDGNANTVSFEYGTSNSDMTAFSKLSDVTLNDNSEYPAAQKVEIKVNENGKYYFAFHCTSQQFNGTVLLFEFKLYEEGGSVIDPPDEPIVSIPYHVDLTTDYADWTAVDNNRDSHTWTPVNNFGPMLEMPLTGQNDDDYFSPKISLKGGVTYKITTNVAVQGYPKGYDVVTLTQGTDKTNMTPLKQLNLINSGENIEENYFTPGADGDYYFSFYNTSNSGGNTLQLYSFAIEEYAGTITPETEIYTTDFTGTDPLKEWTIIDSNNDNVKWAIIDGYTGPSYDGNLSMSAADDWLISPALDMVAGKDYLIRYTISQAGAFEADELTIKYGTAPTAKGLDKELAKETINLNSGSVEKIIRFTCTESASTYIGFNLTTPVPNGIVTINKISVVQTSKAQPMSVENLDVSSNFTQKNVTFKWKNPSYDVTNAPILSPVDINIYENGVRVGSVENCEAGSTGTYTYNPKNFGGIVTYKVTASLNGIESLPVEFEINLDDVQGEAAVVREFMTANDYTEWIVENKDGGNTWQQITYEDGGMSVKRGNKDIHDDWAITPGVTLEPNKRYIIKFYVSTSMNYAGSLDVWLGNSQTSAGMTSKLISLEDICYNGYVDTTTPQFSVETEGVYYIGFHDSKTANSMIIKGVGIYYIDTDEKEVPVMEIPYTETFDQSATTPNGWKISRSSTQYGFYVSNISLVSKTFGTRAYSGANALYAAGGAPEAREEIIYTPKFTLESGKTYNISFMLNMTQNNSKNTLSLYKATEQDESNIIGESLLQTDETTNKSWIKQNIEISVDNTSDYCFAIKINTNEANGGEIIIDNFNVDEQIQIATVKPAAILNAKASAINSNKSVLFEWTHPLVDEEGEKIQNGSIINTKIYDGDEFIAEHSVKVTDNTKPLDVTYVYTYSDNSKFSGQKIYKLIPCIDKEIGQPTSCVLKISSFTDGYLKEHTYVADFAEDNNRWKTIDGDEDGNTWSHDESAITTNGKDEWLISPEVKLDPTKSYYVLCEFETDLNQSVNIKFTRGNGQTINDQIEIIDEFNDIIMNDYTQMEVGTTFHPESESNFFGIHIENMNGTNVRIKNLKIMRLFTSDEPEPLPYSEDFENRTDINETTLFTNKWGCRTSSSELFHITTMPDNTITAHSGEYAAVANEYTIGGRNELLYTPYFTLEHGKTYEISFYLYMPGNGENKTTANVILAYTQEESGIELPVLQNISEPVKEWTKFTIKYVPEYDMDYCFYFEFNAESANSGIIAFDDFKIEEVEGTDIKENIEKCEMHYISSTSTLYVPDNIKSVSVFNVQGQNVLNTQCLNNTISLAELCRGIYIVKAMTNDGNTLSMKLVKK
ncbi:T9SS-dependent choice-of-anchor J family protein [Prevotella marseillensis]|uniref:T9SS-dependent choice-of-anchor J family protein n=1 Tax=Prevotella marseillensis TaxID=2479840 RepID=UPI000F641CAD|nr:choice-of-anchor J domain-containing protein [Prevotella marseillensis]